MNTSSKLKELPFFDLFDKFIKNSKSGRRSQSNGKKISQGSVQNYIATRRLLEQFSNEKKYIFRIRPIKYLDKKQMIVERNYWLRFYKKFTDYLYTDCNHFDNYVGQNIKIVRAFFNYLNKELLIGAGEFHKSFYVPNEQIPIVTLLPEELNFLIYDIPFESGLSQKLKQVKDIFVFGCTVALRFSDLANLKSTNLRIANNHYYLIVRSKKTTTDTRIKLPDYVVAIVLKYKDKYKTLLPFYNKTDLNLYLKQLIEKAGLIHEVGKIRSKRGCQKEILKSVTDKKTGYRFCDMVTTHTMRRTAITTMLSMGVPEHLVRKVSGHSPMSKEFFRYVAFSQVYQDNETEKMFEQLKDRRLA